MKRRVFIADWLPLANKGEEALAQGIGDLLCGKEDVEIGIFDNVDRIETVRNIKVFPRSWVYQVSGCWFSLSSRERLLKNLKIMVQDRLGFVGRISHLDSKDRQYTELKEFFITSQVIVVGHGPMFCPESAILTCYAASRGKTVVMFSGGVYWPSKPIPHPWFMIPMLNLFTKPLYRKAIHAMKYCSLRNQTSYEVFRGIAGTGGLVRQKPDVAFAMVPENRESAEKYLGGFKQYRRARKTGIRVVCATVCIASSTYNGSFIKASSAEDKLKMYYEFMVQIFNYITRDLGAVVMFLPHSIDERVGDDVAVARQILQRGGFDSEKAFVIEDDLSPRLLKAIIKECDFMIGQRAHSIIGAVSVGTPFVNLTNSKDTRSQEIFGKTCRQQDWIFNLDDPDVESLRKILDRLVATEGDRKRELREIGTKLIEELREDIQPVRSAVLKKIDQKEFIETPVAEFFE